MRFPNRPEGRAGEIVSVDGGKVTGGRPPGTDRATTRRMKLSTRRWLSISRAAPSGSPAHRQAISRRRELAVIPSAAGPTAAMRQYAKPAPELSTWTSAGSSAAPARRRKVSA